MNITKKYLLEQSRKMCLRCQSQQKLCTEHCSDSDCPLYPARMHMIDQSKQLSMFTEAGFYAACETIIKQESPHWLRELFFSDIRERIELMMADNGDNPPAGKQINAWWGNISRVLRRNGWKRDAMRYRRTKTRHIDHLYCYQPEFKRPVTF